MCLGGDSRSEWFPSFTFSSDIFSLNSLTESLRLRSFFQVEENGATLWGRLHVSSTGSCLTIMQGVSSCRINSLFPARRNDVSSTDATQYFRKSFIIWRKNILVKLSSALKDCAEHALYLTSTLTRGFQTVPISALKCLTELAGKKKNSSSSCVSEGT